MKSCLNLSQLQTGLVEEHKKLSELKVTSDSFGRETQKVDSTRYSIGQDQTEKTQKSYPNLNMYLSHLTKLFISRIINLIS